MGLEFPKPKKEGKVYPPRRHRRVESPCSFAALAFLCLPVGLVTGFGLWLFG